MAMELGPMVITLVLTASNLGFPFAQVMIVISVSLLEIQLASTYM